MKLVMSKTNILAISGDLLKGIWQAKHDFFNTAFVT